MIYTFRFWTEWCDEQGRLWAEPYEFDTSTDARRAHKGALGWAWTTGKHRPSVSNLYSVAFKEDPVTGKKREENRTTIQEGGAREYHEAALFGVRPADNRNPLPPAPDTTRTAKEPDRFDTPF